MNNQPLIGPVALLKSAWSFYKPHWKILTAMILIPYAGLYIGLGLQSVGGTLFGLLGGLVSIAGTVCLVAGYAAVIGSFGKIDADATAKLSLGAQFSSGFKIFWSIVLVGIIIEFVTVGSMLAFVIPGIVIAFYSSFALFALVLDGKKGFSALTESFSIVKGRWWKVFGRCLFMAAINLIALLIAIGLQFVMAFLFGYDTHSGVGVFVSLVLQGIVTALLIPVALAYSYKLYLALKASRIPDVSVKAFKRWLVAFIVVAALCAIGAPIILASLYQAKKLGMDAQMKAQDAAQQSSPVQPLK